MEYGIEYLVPVTIALVEVVKRLNLLPANLMPVVSLLIGGILGYFAGLEPLQLLLVGLGASGLYDLGKEPVRAAVAKVRG